MKRILSLLLCLAMLAALSVSSMAVEYTDGSVSSAQDEISADIALQLAEEGIVLLENEDGALPVSGGQAAVFGATADGVYQNRMTRPMTSTGTNITTAFEAAGWQLAFWDGGSANVTASNDAGQMGGNWSMSAGSSTDGELTAEDIDTMLAEAGMDTSVPAFYVISRTSTEGTNRTLTKGDYYLTDTEYANIQLMAETFDTAVVILNTVGVIDTNFYDEIEGLDGMVLMGLAGPEGGQALVEILTGEISPSGKTSYTWAVNYEDYPSTQTWGNASEEIAASSELQFETDGTYTDGKTVIYYEGIYTGYRYFDSFNVDPAYPFGFGLSYTDFEITTGEISVSEDLYVTVPVTVTNTGDMAGKEVVQVYFSAPDGLLDKVYQELAAFAKTETLQPGESQEITISYRLDDMSSYSEELAAYILDAGDYIIRVGNCSRNTHVAGVLTLDETAITEQLSNQLEAAADFEELSSEGVTSWGYDGEDEEIASAQHIVVSAADIPTVNNAYNNDAETVTTYTTEAAQAEQAEIDAYYTDSNITSVQVEGHTVSLQGSSASGEASDETGVPAEYASTDGGYADYDSIYDIYYDSDWANWGTLYQILPAVTDKTGSNGYLDGEGYDEDVVVVDEYPDMTLLDVYNGDITLEEFVGNLTAEQCIAIINGIGENGTTDWGITLEKRVDGTAGNTTGAFQADDSYDDGWSESAFNNASELRQSYWDGGALSVEDWDDDSWESLGLPDINMADGPGSLMGRTRTLEEDGQTVVENTIATPAGTVMASTFNMDLIYQAGVCSGTDMVNFDCSYWLAPGMNLIRNPLCGRNLEYFSEDPLLSGMSCAAQVNGVESVPGVGVMVKHFALNNTEYNRTLVVTVASERCEREIYLKGWEYMVKSAQPTGIMSSYNILQDTYTAANYDLLTSILRGEWGYDGLVVTDWTTAASAIDSMHAGNDLLMPGGQHYDVLLDAVNWVEPTFLENGCVCVTKELVYGPKSCYYEHWGDFVPVTVGEVGDTTVIDEELTELYVSEEDRADGWKVVSYAPYYWANTDQMSSYSAGVTHYVVQTDDAGNITAYQGSYVDNSSIYLGDLQARAMRVLNLLMQSVNMEEYYGEDQVQAQSYNAKYDLTEYVVVE